MDLVKHVYQISGQFPNDERYGLTSQMQRAAVSVPSNIAEGWGRETNSYLLNFLRTSKGSLAELDTLSLLARDLHYIESEVFELLNDKIEEVSRMLNGLIRSLNRPKTISD